MMMAHLLCQYHKKHDQVRSPLLIWKGGGAFVFAPNNHIKLKYANNVIMWVYNAQGKLQLIEKFQNDTTTVCMRNEKGITPCESDYDCYDKAQSCRVLPISLNGSIKVCMPDNVQYSLNIPSFPY